MAAADDAIDVGRFEQVADHDLGASGPQGRRPVILAADHGANRKPALEEQAGHGSPDRPELTGCPGYEDRSVIGHATSLPFGSHVKSKVKRQKEKVGADFLLFTFYFLLFHGSQASGVSASTPAISGTVH
jgi:hypothetical protein